MPGRCTDYLKRLADTTWNNGISGASCTLVIIFLLLLAVYWPSYHDHTVLFGRADLWGQFAPMAFYLDHSLSKGDWPQWNPLVFCGVPFAANPQSASYYPPHLIRALLNSSPTPLSTFQSVALMQLIHLIFLGLGVYFLCRRFGLTWFASMAAASGVVLSSTMTYRAVQHWTFIALAAHFPWQLLALHTLLQLRESVLKFRYALALGTLTAHSVLIGSPQILIYPIFCLAAFALLYRFGPGRPVGKWDIWRQVLLNDFMMVCVVLLAALGLSAALLLPLAEYASYCVRAKNFSSADTLADAVLVDQIHSASTVFSALVLYPGMNSLRFLGLIGALLTVCAVFYRCIGNLLLFLALFVIMGDMALGTPMPFASLASWIAPLYLSEPERAMLIGIVVLAVLLAMGIDSCMRPKAGVLGTNSRASLIVAIGFPSAFFLFRALQDEPTSQWWMWVLPAIAVLTLTLAQFKQLSIISMLFTVILFSSHMMLSARDYARNLSYANPYPEDASTLEQTAQWPLENSREIAGKMLENTGMYRLEAVVNGYDPLIPETLDTLLRPEEDKAIYNTRISAEDLCRENTIGHNLLKRRFHLARTYSTSAFPDRSEVNFLPSHVVFLEMGIQPEFSKNCAEEKSWMDALEPMQGKVPVEREKDGAFVLGPIQPDLRHRLIKIIFQNTGTQGVQVYTEILSHGKSKPSMTWELAPGDKTYRKIPLPDFQDMKLRFSFPPGTAMEAVKIKAAILVDTLDTPEDISITAASSDSVKVKITNQNEAAWLLFTEFAYPGWTAYLDGVKTQIYAANVAFQAIELPAGAHEVRFEFDSKTVRFGLQISLVSALLLILILMLLYFIELKSGSADVSKAL